jgi:hypothetical protein
MKRYASLLYIITCCAVGSFAQSKSKAAYVGAYQRPLMFDVEEDTVYARAFFSQDSFAIIYMVKHDSDYQFPLIKGTWQLINDSVAELHYTDKQIKTGKFDSEDRNTSFAIDNVTFRR